MSVPRLLTETDRTQLAGVLRLLPADFVQRGREYAREGRASRFRLQGDVLTGSVSGAETYEVTIRLGPRPTSACTCPASSRFGACKHVAALVTSVLGAPTEASPVPRLDRGPVATGSLPPFPEAIRTMYSASLFFERLAVYVGEPLDPGEVRWVPLRDWWQRVASRPTSQGRALVTVILETLPRILRDLEELRAFAPPPNPSPGTRYGAAYAQIAERYTEAAERAQLRVLLPGPLDLPEGSRGGHPGFDLWFDPKVRALAVNERRAPLLHQPASFQLFLPLRAGEKLRFAVAETSLEAQDSWQLLAMRTLIRALAKREDPVVRAVEQELSRPIWHQVLEQLSGAAPAAPGDVDVDVAPARPRAAEALEHAFCLTPTPREDVFRLVPLSRALGARGRPTKWKKETYETLYDAASSSLERDIARVAQCALEKPSAAVVNLGQAQGHELLRLLAGHGRIHVSDGDKPDPDVDPRASLVVGDASLRLDPDTKGALRPSFLVGGVPVAIEDLQGPNGAGLRGIASLRRAVFVSAYVAPELRKWLDASIAYGDEVAFPPEAVADLARVAEPLLARGVAELPREALGVELPYTPVAALRVDWRVDGAAVVELLIAVHPHAPFVAAGAGPRLFTFLDGGRRVFVEREPKSEPALVERAREALIQASPLTWADWVGRTETFEEAIALATWLEQNPLGFPIELKVGRPPVLVPWEGTSKRFTARREGTWLVLDGAIDVDGAKLTIGDVLEAARLARRYVKVKEGTFVELSEAAREKLEALAFAADLAAPRGAGPGADARIHDAFGSVLAEASEALGSIDADGIDLASFARRLGKAKTRVKVAELEHGELRSYQRDGVAWMLRLASWAPGCVLADDMGLGKTVQTASLLSSRASSGPALVVAPASVSSNWVIELGRFVPSLRVRWYNETRDVDLVSLESGDVVVVSYGLLQRRSDAFAARRWGTLVLDEAQFVKNAAAARTDAVRSLPRDFTVALTGTPLENHLGELYSIVDLAFPGLLGQEGVFRERFRRPIEGGKDPARLARLAGFLAPFLLRRTRASVLSELPPREEITEMIDLAPDEAKRYLALRRACEMELSKDARQARKKAGRAKPGGESPAQFKIALLAALTRLRQLACDVRLVDPAFEGSSTKIDRAVELAGEIAAEGSHALIFSQFTQLLWRVRDALQAAGLRVGYLDGETPTTKRRVIIDQFQRGELDVFCVSLLAGGTGLNLTKATYVLHLDPWWNPAAEEQATSRAHRMGQSAPVTVYRLVARGTIEEAVVALHGTKRELADAVLEGKDSTRAVSPEDLMKLLRFGEGD
jgi:superfamily II DNA or RNA helicase